MIPDLETKNKKPGYSSCQGLQREGGGEGGLRMTLQLGEGIKKMKN